MTSSEHRSVPGVVFANYLDRMRTAIRSIARACSPTSPPTADAQHPDRVVLIYRTLALFADCGDTPKVTRQQLLGAKRRQTESAEWQADTANGALRFTPFWNIENERHSRYLPVIS